MNIARTRVVTVRFAPEEHKRITHAADRLNVSISNFLRAAALTHTRSGKDQKGRHTDRLIKVLHDLGWIF